MRSSSRMASRKRRCRNRTPEAIRSPIDSAGSNAFVARLLVSRSNALAAAAVGYRAVKLDQFQIHPRPTLSRPRVLIRPS